MCSDHSHEDRKYEGIKTIYSPISTYSPINSVLGFSDYMSHNAMRSLYKL